MIQRTPLSRHARLCSCLRLTPPSWRQRTPDWPQNRSCPLRAACLLSDISWRAHPDYRGEQGLNVIANAAFTGIDHPGRAYLALTGYFRHEGVAPEKASPTLRDLAGPRLFDRARLIAALLRVAFPVSAGMEGTLRRTALAVEDGKVVLRMPEEWRALAGDRVLNRVRGLGRVIGLDGRVDIG